MDNKHVKRFSTLFVIRELQIKTMRYYYTLIKMAKIQKLTISNVKIFLNVCSEYTSSENNRIFLQEMRKREYLHHKTTTTTVRYSRKIKNSYISIRRKKTQYRKMSKKQNCISLKMNHRQPINT